MIRGRGVTFENHNGIAYPTVQAIIQAHRIVYDASQSSNDVISFGPPNVGNIEGALAHIRDHVGKRGSQEARIITKAAHLMLRIMAGHAFTDGNKRTSFTIGMLFLTVNGIEMRDLSFDQYTRSLAFFRRIASSTVHDTNSIRALRSWIQRRVEHDN